jgi:hypothetical protein
MNVTTSDKKRSIATKGNDRSQGAATPNFVPMQKRRRQGYQWAWLNYPAHEWQIPTFSKEFSLQCFFENHLPVAHEHLRPFLEIVEWGRLCYEMDHPLESPNMAPPGKHYEIDEPHNIRESSASERQII